MCKKKKKVLLAKLGIEGYYANLLMTSKKKISILFNGESLNACSIDQREALMPVLATSTQHCAEASNQGNQARER
jgi:hypothetical protein